MKMAVSIRKIIIGVGVSFLLLLLLLALWVWRLNSQINERLSQGWFLPPLEFYSEASALERGVKLNRAALKHLLLAQGYKEIGPQERLRAKDFVIWDLATCQQNVAIELLETTSACFVLRSEPKPGSTLLQLIVTDADANILDILEGEPLQQVTRLSLRPVRFAQYYGSNPILRDILSLGDVPLQCLQAVTALEDEDFLEHAGVSVSGTVRAVMRNLTSGRYAQGGSTITQQLVKNFFLTPEKTIKRKITEQVIALLLEARYTKDQIFEHYLNVIYLGQNGVFQVLGFGAASRHYFNTEVSRLNLSQCALLAAIINNPGRFNPFNKPEAAKTRRHKALTKMNELGMISNEELETADQSPLPTMPPRLLSEPAPYYIQAILKRLEEENIDASKGLRIYSHLDPTAQEIAQTQLASEMQRLEKEFPRIKKIKGQGKSLQAALIAVDLRTNGILALVGGREFKRSQYNRAVDSRRQVGSIMKPFVYLAALENTTPDGDPYDAVTIISDEPLEHRYEGQRWKPTNYDGKFHGKVPLFVALKESLNVSTARLGLDIGLDNIVDVAKRLGIESPVKALPSISLGAFELGLLEVARAYTAIARMGSYSDIHLLRRVENLNGEVLFNVSDTSTTVVEPRIAAKLIGMLKQTVKNGTARSIQWRGFTNPAAGKTGTTSDSKDAWFIGFTPSILTLVWVGYDDNTSHGLTGSSGAVPLWTQFMKAYASRYTDQDFAWPEGSKLKEYSVSDLQDLFKETQNLELPQEAIELVF